MITETETKVAYFDPTDLDSETGQPKVKITSEDAFNKKLKDATEAKTALPEVKATGSFVFSYPQTIDEAVQLAGGNGVGEYENVDILLAHIRYAYALRQHNTTNELLKGDSYVQSDNAVDMAYCLAEKVERAKMSAEEKAVKILAAGGLKISPEQLKAALESIRGQQAATQIAGQ